MFWIILVSVTVVIAAGFSIAASRDSRRDIESGHPTFHSVADVTGIWNRSTVDQLIGPRDVDDRYAVTAEQVYSIPQTWWKRWFDNDLCDRGCIVLALAAPLLFRYQSALAMILLTVSAAYVVVGYVGAVWVVVSNGSWSEP